MVLLITTISLTTKSTVGQEKTLKNKAATSVSLGPSVISISGRQVIVRKRNQDGTLATPKAYVIRGVNWSPASRGTNTSKTDANNANVRRPEFGIWAATDIPLIKNMNVNTVLVPMDFGLDDAGMSVLDQFYANGIMVVMTVDDGNNSVTRVQQAVNFYRNHPAILAWMLGNEWNINRYFTSPKISILEAVLRTEKAAALIHTLDSNHPVATSYGEIDIDADGLRLADTQNYVNNICRSVDLWALNIYRGNTFGSLFDQWKLISSKPMLLGEFGTDAFRSATLGNPPFGSVDGVMQSQWNMSEWNHLFKNLSATDPVNAALGGFVFEFNDEWWKVSPAGSQQMDGFVLNGGHPDNLANEEIFGIVDIDRQVRSVYQVLKSAFDETYQPPQTATYRAVSRGGTVEASEYPSQHGVALFFRNGEILYRAEGGGLGGRGFNVAVIDSCTNTLLRPVQHFDTWATRNTGEALNEMIAFLDSLPNGVLIMISVADEAGLNNFPPDCTHLTNQYVEPSLQKLESLGSKKIRNYCYNDSWSMVTVKGEAQARAEEIGTNIEVAAQTTLPRIASIAPVSKSFSATGGTGSVALTMPGSCDWSATSSSGFVSITSANTGTGDKVISYSVAPNAGPVRTGTLNVAGLVFTVTQESGCTFALSSTGQNFTAGGGPGTVNVTTATACGWTATTDAGFVSISSGNRFNGNGTVEYSLVANTSNSSRIGTITIAGQPFTVSQSAPTPTPTLLTEQGSALAIALDSVTMLRDPFPVVNPLSFVSDHRTRVMLFAINVNLLPGESPSVLTAQVEDSEHRVFPLTVEFIGSVPNVEGLTQLNVKLPDEISSGGVVQVSINFRSVSSNKVTLRINPP
jgi:hypothetical protein